jgi:hypothetical protein
MACVGLERIDTIVRCLRIILELGGTTSHESFGRRLWPDAVNWRRSPGRQLKASAGLLGRLCARGFLVRVGRGIYSITPSGRSVANGGYPSPTQPASPPGFAQAVPAAVSYVPAYPQPYAQPQAPMYPPQAVPPVPAPASPPQPWSPTVPPAAPFYPQPPPTAPSPQAPMPWPWPPPWWPR